MKDTELSTNDRPVVIQVQDQSHQSERRFQPSLRNTKYWEPFTHILANDELLSRIAKTISEIHHVNEHELKSYLPTKAKCESLIFNFQPLPWYLDEFFNGIVKNMKDYAVHEIIVNSAHEHMFYALERTTEPEDEKSWEVAQTPFFQKSPPPTPTKSQPQQVRGLADTLLFLAPTIVSANNSRARRQGFDLHSLFQWFEITLQVSSSAITRHKGIYNFPLYPHIATNKYLELRSQVDSRGVKVLVSSPNMRCAIAKVAQIWTATNPQSAIIIAPSGSGKEELFKLLAAGYRGQVVKASAPTLQSWSALKNLLRANSKLLSSKSILFLDEIHHSSATKLRQSMLRLVETRELPADDAPADRLHLKCMFLFAASKPLSSLRKLAPLDFWTRIEHTISIQHPLMLDKSQVREEVLADYFDLFWGKELEDFEEHHRHRYGLLIGKLTPARVDNIKKRFVSQLSSPLIPLISVRELRSIISRLFTHVVTELRCSDSKQAREVFDHIRITLPDWLNSVFREFVPDGSGSFSE